MRRITIINLIFIQTILISGSLYAQFSQVSSTLTDCTDDFIIADDTYDNYPRMGTDDTCRILISIPDAKKINFQVNDNSLKSSDRLIIFNGNNYADSIYKHGNLEPTEFSSSSNIVKIEFINSGNPSSDFSVQWQGQLDYTSNITHVDCSGNQTGSITITASYSGSSISWYNLDVDPGTDLGNPSLTLANVAAANYRAVVGNASECYLEDTFEITEPAALLLNAETDSDYNGYGVSCNGYSDGTITANPTGGVAPYNYQWDADSGAQTTQTASGLSAGVNYEVTVTDDNGCTADNVGSPYTLTQPTALTLNAETDSDYNGYGVSCNGGSNGQITANPTGGTSPYTYQWDADTDVGSGAQVTKKASGLTAGVDYTVTVTDANGCTVNNDGSVYNLTQPAVLTLDPETNSDYHGFGVSCNGSYDGTITANPTGGVAPYTYQWDTDTDGGSGAQTTQTASGLSAGVNYEVTVTDANGCTVYNNSSYTITEPTVITFNTQSNSDYNGYGVSCNGGSNGQITANPTGGVGPYNYQWDADTDVGSGAQATKKASGLTAGVDYTVTVTDANGCTVNNDGSIYNLTQPAVLTITQDDLVNVTVYGQQTGSIDISVSNFVNAVSFDWTGVNTVDLQEDQSGLPAGFYSVTVTDDNTCTANKSFEITQPAALNAGQIEVNGTNSEIVCNNTLPSLLENKTIASGGSGTYTYKWQYSTDQLIWNDISASNTISYDRGMLLTQDLYFRRLVDDQATTAVSNVLFLDYNPPYTVSIQNLDTAYCHDASDITLSGIPSSVTSTFSSPAASIVDLGNGAATFSPNSTPVSALAYNIKYVYQDANGCKDSITQQVFVRKVPTPYFSMPEAFGTDASPHTINGATPYGGTFSGPAIIPSDSTFYPSNLSEGTYTITYNYQNEFGCSNSYAKDVDIIEGIGTITLSGTNDMQEKYCIDGEDVLIEGKPKAGYTMTYGSFRGYNKDNSNPITYGIDLGNMRDGIIKPYNLSAGTYVIEFTYGNGTSEFTISTEITIYDVTHEANILDLQSAYCNYEQVETINASELSGGDIGIFSGPGITDNGDASASLDINAASISPNPIAIKYLFTDNESGCQDSVVRQVNINPKPNAYFETKDLFNSLGEATKFTNIEPDGGIFSGEGVSKIDSTFNPVAVDPGNYEISYTVSDANSCQNTKTVNVVVEDAKGTFGGINTNNIYCIDEVIDKIYYQAPDADPFTPVDFKIDDQTVSITDTALFNPSDWGAGNHQLKFSYLGRDGITLFWITENIFVDDIGIISIESPDNDFCNYDGNQILIGKLNNNDAGYGLFSGDGVILDLTNDGSATFVPSSANIGDNKIYYTYNSKTNGSSCFKSDSAILVVHDRPVLDYSLHDIYNINGPNDTINPSPSGGYFSPIASFINNNIFIPSTATVGDYNLTYNYTDEFGCFNSLTKTAIIKQSTGSITGIDANNIYCSDGAEDVVRYEPENTDIYTPVQFTLGNDTLSVNVDTAVINPKNYTAGTYTLTYNYLGTDGLTEFSISEDITFDHIGNLNVSIPSYSYCEYEEAQEVIGYIDGAVAALGIFTGNGINPTDATNDGKAFFNPQSAEIGSNVITYTYYSAMENSSCYKTLESTVEVYATTPLNFSIPEVYNIDGSLDTLQASPSGGVYTPTYFITQDSLFDPGLADLGSIDITYTYENENGCISSTIASSEIQKASGLFISLEDAYCYNAPTDNISFTGITNPITAVGTFSGFGITNTGDNSATFNPQLAYDLTNNPQNDTVVDVSITFTYLGEDDSTEFQVTQITQVRNNGAITINNLNSNYCANDNPVTLSASPVGGSFSGNGVSGFIFDPKQVVLASDTAVTYTYNDNDLGCTITKSEPIKIITIPELEIVHPPQVCSNGSKKVITGYPRGGDLYYDFDNLIYTTTDSLVFQPSANDVGSQIITYSYTSPLTGCSNEISETIIIDTIPDLSIVTDIDNLNIGICVDSDTVDLQGRVNGADANTGIFSGSGIVYPDINSGVNKFKPDTSIIGNNQIYFTYTNNATQCTNTDSITIIVNQLPELNITGYLPGYCEYVNNKVTVIGSQQAVEANEVSIISFNDLPTENNIAEFTPSEYSNVDSVVVEFFHTNEFGCSNTITDTIQIWNRPNPNFSVSDICIADPIDFEFLDQANMDKIKSYIWNFGDGDDVTDGSDTLGITSHLYGIEDIQNDITISLMVTDTNNCYAERDTIIALEQNPDANFVWTNECFNGNAVEIQPNIINTQNYMVEWQFGDNQSSNEYQPAHTYADTGAYIITYTVSSIKSTCFGQKQKQIHIRPVIHLVDLDDNYMESFENGHGGWIAEPMIEDEAFSWDYGVPAANKIKTAADGQHVYATNLSGSYYPEEKSMVTSPCFDFSEMDKPMISIDIFRQMENKDDGVVIEYSADQGQTWKRVGATNEGINWYNQVDLSSEPGIGQSQGWDDSNNLWETARHDLNVLRGQANVRFRIAFATTNDVAVKEGFAFDNIIIGNRSRRVLVEHFTNNQFNNAVYSDGVINNIIDQNPMDAIDIQYHTSTSTADPIYKNYPLGVSARESYYDITDIPYTIFDGTKSFDFNENTPDNSSLLTQALIDPWFDIQLETTKTENTINISSRVKALADITNRQLQIFTAIVEKTVVLNDNDELVYQNVLRNFLPNTAGEYIESTWAKGDERLYEYTYSKDDYVAATDSVTVITFIQDELSKEILQAATDDTTSLHTSAKNWLANHLDNDFFIYPNPANNKTNFVFEAEKKDLKFQIINQQGQVLFNSNIPKNQKYLQHNCAKYPEGIYFIQIQNSEFQKTKKLIIYH